jgi:hypothetical protein
MKSGSLNLLEPSGPVKACNGIAVLYCTLVTGHKKETVEFPQGKHPPRSTANSSVSAMHRPRYTGYLDRGRKGKYAATLMLTTPASVGPLIFFLCYSTTRAPAHTHTHEYTEPSHRDRTFCITSCQVPECLERHCCRIMCVLVVCRIFFAQCHHVSLIDFVASPPGCGRSVTEF